MRWQIITCDNSKKIVEAQKYLFSKYAPDVNLEYIDLKDEPVETWSVNVLNKLNTNDLYTILGLDDFLPIRELPNFALPEDFDRAEIGGSKVTRLMGDEPYRVSCQFSVWKTKSLAELLKTPRSPWQFEKQGNLNRVYQIETPTWYINESAISGRQKGKVNLCGLKKEDIDDLIVGNLVKEEEIVYGWSGDERRTKESYGTKYATNYNQ